MISIHSPIPAIITFSVREMKPKGTLLSPPTQAHFNSRLSIQTALITEIAPTVPMNSAKGAENYVSRSAVISTPATASAQG